ncbi:MAG: hypothetical protein IJ523_03445 [Succinivibrionaceae bacterium]|nr:hypothetical protein [Succinivibrionaceae bacterium]
MNYILLSVSMALARPLISLVLRKTGLVQAGAQSRDVPYFTLVHQLPGRARYASELLKEAEFASKLESRFLELSGIKTVKINPRTGTILLTYSLEDGEIKGIFARINRDFYVANQAARSSDFPDALKQFMGLGESMPPEAAGDSNGVSQAAPPVPAGAAGGANARFRDHFFDNLSNISGRIHSCTRGFFDLPSLLGTLLICRGFYKMVKFGQMPSGPQLIWWGYSFFKIRGKNVRALPFDSQNTSRS